MIEAKKEAKELIYKYQYLVPTWDCYNDCDIEIEHRLPAMKKCALESVEFALKYITGDLNESFDKTMYLLDIKKEIENYKETNE
jgi:hypothetical protein